VYNAALNECFRRIERMKHSTEYRAIEDMKPKTRMVKGADGKPKREFTPEYKAARQALLLKYGFSEYSLNGWAKSLTGTWVTEGLNGQVFRAVVRRAFMTAAKFYFGKGGKPKFKSKRTPLESIENSTNLQGLVWRDGYLLWNKNDLKLKAVVDMGEPRDRYALSCRVKYPRLVRKDLNGKARYFVQLVLEGWPYPEPEKRTAPSGSVVGFDLGPSKVAIVTDTEARYEPLLPELRPAEKALRRLDRRMDRQRRASNPDNYHADGTVKRGKRKWKKSRRYLVTQAKRADVYRKLAAQRKTLQGEFTNGLLRAGETIKAEKLNYVAWQRNRHFGRRVQRNAPGMMLSLLRRKAGKRLYDIDVFKTRLSQFCVCGRYQKKPLSQRQHECECGAKVQRDVFSAYGARFVDETTGRLDAAKLLADWPDAEPRLQTASSGKGTGKSGA